MLILTCEVVFGFPFLLEISAKQQCLQLETIFNLLYASRDWNQLERSLLEITKVTLSDLRHPMFLLHLNVITMKICDCVSKTKCMTQVWMRTGKTGEASPPSRLMSQLTQVMVSLPTAELCNPASGRQVLVGEWQDWLEITSWTVILISRLIRHPSEKAGWGVENVKQKQTNSEFGNPFKEQEQIFNYFKRDSYCSVVCWQTYTWVGLQSY